MKCFLAFTLLAAAISAQAAVAFSEDNESMNTPAANAKFSDPDEKNPLQGTITVQPGFNAQNPDSPIGSSYTPTPDTRAPSSTPLDNRQ